MNQIRYLCTITLMCLALAGCSYLEDFFPDKEKDYQYTSEIPLLNWPSELRNNKSNADADAAQSSGGSDSAASTEAGNTQASESSPAGDNPSGASGESQVESTNTTAVSPTEIKNSDEDGRNTISSVEIVKYDDGESRLRLGAGFSRAWRAVSKALTHNSIEVTERNHDQGFFTLQYDPDEKKAQDDSYLDEILFFFKGIDTNEQEYRLKLEEHADGTDVLVLDKEHLPMLKNEAALQLLKVIGNTIKADQSEKKAE